MVTNDEIIAAFKQLYAARGLKIKTDGIVCSDTFARTSPKILWILKEFNGGRDNEEGDILTDLRECAQNCRLGGYSKTYELIVKTSWLILQNQWREGWNQPYENIPDANALCRAVLPRIAVINVKKVAGGGEANEAQIAATYAEEEIKKQLCRQIAAIGPDIIINASGVVQLFNDLTHLNLQDRTNKEHRLYKQSYWLDTMKCGCFTWAKTKQYTVVHVYHPNRPKSTNTKAEYVHAILKCLADSTQQ